MITIFLTESIMIAIDTLIRELKVPSKYISCSIDDKRRN
jgi:hypothetical protein